MFSECVFCFYSLPEAGPPKIYLKFKLNWKMLPSVLRWSWRRRRCDCCCSSATHLFWSERQNVKAEEISTGRRFHCVVTLPCVYKRACICQMISTIKISKIAQRDFSNKLCLKFILKNINIYDIRESTFGVWEKYL